MNIFNRSVFSLRSRASALAVVALLGLSIGLSGCKGSKGDPGAIAAAQPTGTIQGVLADNVTHQPIVGAIVDIGVATATTNADGQFVLRNVVVPVDAANNANAAAYGATIDLRKVTSPVNMASAAATPRYPDFHYRKFTITFTSLYASAASAVTATPVTGLIANVDFAVGKLAATITGVVADSLTKQPVAAGYIVKLVSLDSWQPLATNSGMGATENVVGSTTTDASGNFTFANIESLQSFRIDAWNSTNTIKGSGIGVLNAGTAVVAPADGETKTLSIQGGTAVLVASTDILAPTIISVTPEQNADIAPAGGASVVFTFSEPILQTADTSTSSSVPTGLYNTVAVNYTGAKASNIPYSLSWNATSTQLTVTIPTLAAASKYTVSLAGTGTTLKDANNNVVTNIATAGKGVLSFTTNGSPTAAAPATVTVVNSASLDFNSPSVLLNWSPVSGAKAYNVYRAQNYTGVTGQYQLILPALATVSTLTSDFADTLPVASFVSGQNMLTYSYVVRSVNMDNVESADSAAVTAQDLVKPTAIIPAVTTAPVPPAVAPAVTLTITFSEPVDEASATTLTNYGMSNAVGFVGAIPAVTNAILNPGLLTVALTLSAAPVVGNVITITGVTDIAGNTMTGATLQF
ncbi:MAG: hypothetical protein HY935_07865 [Nitrosomonadales bacterium]|nr:hypothetical protein [Nitrosomonadales bacterium]